MADIKKLITAVLGEDVVFNKDFDKHVLSLKGGMFEDFISWIKNCETGNILGSVPPKREFKDLYVFFRKIGNSKRAVLIKRQNSDFVELILSEHLAYDKKRKELGFKKSSYYKS